MLALGGSFVKLADPDLDGDPDLFVGFNGPPCVSIGMTPASARRRAALLGGRGRRAPPHGRYDADGDPDLWSAHADDRAALYRNDRPAAGGRLPSVQLRMCRGGRAPSRRRGPPAPWIDVVRQRSGPSSRFAIATTSDSNDGCRFTDIAASAGLADAPGASAGLVRRRRSAISISIWRT